MTESFESNEQEPRRRRPMFDAEREDDGFVFRVRPPQIPEDFREHLMTAQREFLLAFRSLLDEVIDRSEPKDHPSSGPRNVQVS